MDEIKELVQKGWFVIIQRCILPDWWFTVEAKHSIYGNASGLDCNLAAAIAEMYNRAKELEPMKKDMRNWENETILLNDEIGE